MLIIKNRLSQSFILLAFSILLLAGCDNGDDQASVGGSDIAPASGTSTDLNNYLTSAINDEYKARDTYRAVIDKFGQVRPFSNIIKSEEQHIRLLANLFNTYGLPVPSDTVGGLPAPASLGDACRVGVQAEIDNAKMYDRLLNGTDKYSDVQAVFRQLQSASLNQHLPAFQRCAN